MREILFRGKRQNNGEWIDGLLLYDYSTFYRKHMWAIQHLNKFGTPISQVEVDRNTIGQYTGLTDKNGKRIFEGDILKGDKYPYSYDGECNYFAEVVWFDDCPAFGLYTFKNPQSNVRGLSAGNSDFMDDFASSEWEVIGNIHDNPELLNGGTNDGD